MTKKAAEPPARISGFCNITLPRTKGYDPHQRCPGCDCKARNCPCNPEENPVLITASESGSGQTYVVSWIDLSGEDRSLGGWDSEGAAGKFRDYLLGAGLALEDAVVVEPEAASGSVRLGTDEA